MSGLIRSELLKQRTTRTSLALLAWMAGLILLVVLLHVFSLGLSHVSTLDGQLKVVGWGTAIGALFASLLGALSMTAEIRHGTIRPTFLAIPRRERVITAKLAAGALTGLGVGLLAEALTAAIGLGVGAIVRQQVGAVVALCVWLLLIETTLIGNVPSAGKFAPGAAAGAIAGAIQTQSSSKLVAPGVGGLLLVAYAATAAAAGVVLTNRRDVA